MCQYWYALSTGCLALSFLPYGKKVKSFFHLQYTPHTSFILVCLAKSPSCWTFAVMQIDLWVLWGLLPVPSRLVVSVECCRGGGGYAVATSVLQLDRVGHLGEMAICGFFPHTSPWEFSASAAH